MCTLEKRGSVFILTLTGQDEHRFDLTLIEAVHAALRRVRSDSDSSSAALVTTAHGKFFSNGYDLAWVKSGGPASATNHRLKLMSSKYRSLIADLLSLPLPTIAAVTGHASAAGFIFAICHDYRLMRKDRGFLYMSELDIRLPLPVWFTSVLKSKIGSPAALRDVLLTAAKLTAEAAVAGGIIDSSHDSAEETVLAAVKLGEELARRRWDGHVYAQIRTVMYADMLNAIRFDETEEDESLVSKIASRL